MNFFRDRVSFQSLRPLAICVGLAIAIQGSLASAATVTGLAQPGSYTPALARVTLDDSAAGPGNISVTVEVVPSPRIGEIRGVYFHISDESLLGPGDPFSVVGPDITDSAFSANSVNRLSNGTHTNSDYDMGFDIGTAGLVDDDVQSTTFVLSHDAVALTVNHFQLQDFAVRLTNVGFPGGQRSHLTKSKLVGTFSVPVAHAPEPTTGLACSLVAAFGIGRTSFRRTRKPTSS